MKKIVCFTIVLFLSSHVFSNEKENIDAKLLMKHSKKLYITSEKYLGLSDTSYNKAINEDGTKVIISSIDRNTQNYDRTLYYYNLLDKKAKFIKIGTFLPGFIAAYFNDNTAALIFQKNEELFVYLYDYKNNTVNNDGTPVLKISSTAVEKKGAITSYDFIDNQFKFDDKKPAKIARSSDLDLNKTPRRVSMSKYSYLNPLSEILKVAGIDGLLEFEINAYKVNKQFYCFFSKDNSTCGVYYIFLYDNEKKQLWVIDKKFYGADYSMSNYGIPRPVALTIDKKSMMFFEENERAEYSPKQFDLRESIFNLFNANNSDKIEEIAVDFKRIKKMYITKVVKAHNRNILVGIDETGPNMTEIDSAGNTLWSKSYYVAGDQVTISDAIYSDYGIPDKGVFYILIRSVQTKIQPMKSNTVLIKIDKDGYVLSRSNYAGTFTSIAMQPFNTGLFVAGFTDMAQLYLANMDLSGKIVSDNTIKIDTTAYGWKLIQTAKNNFFMINSAPNGLDSVYATCFLLSSSTHVSWMRSYNIDGAVRPADIILTDDKGALIIGSKASHWRDSKHEFLMKIDADGNSEWVKTYDYGASYALTKLLDKNYLMLGRYISEDGRGVFVKKVNAKGEIIWSNTNKTCLTNSVIAGIGAVENTNGNILIIVNDGSCFMLNKDGKRLW